MDILIEILIEVYMEFMILIVPEKNITKKHKIIAFIMALIVIAGVFALVIWGVVLITEKNNMLGVLPIAFAVMISLAQIIAGIMLYKKNH